MGVTEMQQIGGFMARALARPGDADTLEEIRCEVEVLCRRFPLYVDRWDDRA